MIFRHCEEHAMKCIASDEAISWKEELKTDCFTAKKRRFAMTAQSKKGFNLKLLFW